MSAQTLDSLSPYPKSSESVGGIAGGSPTFARLQGRSRRPMWMTAAPIAVIVAAAGAALFAISAHQPSANHAVAPDAASAAAAAPAATPPASLTAHQSLTTAPPAPTHVAAATTRVTEHKTVTVHRVARTAVPTPRAPAATAQGRDVTATTPAAPSPTLPAPVNPPTLTQPAPTPDTAPSVPQVPQAPQPPQATTPNPSADPQTPHLN